MAKKQTTDGKPIIFSIGGVPITVTNLGAGTNLITLGIMCWLAWQVYFKEEPQTVSPTECIEIRDEIGKLKYEKVSYSTYESTLNNIHTEIKKIEPSINTYFEKQEQWVKDYLKNEIRLMSRDLREELKKFFLDTYVVDVTSTDYYIVDTL